MVAPSSKPSSDTRARIQEVARELFTQKGVQRTSLQDIANRLGITKPALYYHFRSREDLVRSILTPLIEEGEAFVVAQERRRGSKRATPRELLEGYFDFHATRHAAITAGAEVMSLLDLKEFARHAKIEMTLRYTHPKKKNLINAVARLPSLPAMARAARQQRFNNGQPAPGANQHSERMAA